jgi:prophage antirepressor-like protein
MIYSPTKNESQELLDIKSKEIFTNDLFGELTIMISNDEKLYFIANEVTDALGYVRSRDAITQHCKGALKHRIGVQTGIKKDGTPATQQVEKNIIPESDVYRLIMRSTLPSAEKFQDWVMEDVLPSIRKRGMYATDNVIDNFLNNPDFAIKILTEYKKEKQKRKEEEEKRVIAEEKVKLLTHVEKMYTATEIAKECGLSSAIALNMFLSQEKIHYKVNDTWVPYSEYSNKGYFHLKQEVLDTGKVIYHRKITQMGREFIIDLINKKASN